MKLDPRNPAAVMAAYENDESPITPNAAKCLAASLERAKRSGKWILRAQAEPKPVTDPSWMFWGDILGRSALVLDTNTAWLVTADQMDAIRAIKHIKDFGSIDYPDSPVFGFGRSGTTTRRAAGNTFGLLELPLSFAGELISKFREAKLHTYVIDAEPAQDIGKSSAVILSAKPKERFATLDEAIKKFASDYKSKVSIA